MLIAALPLFAQNIKVTGVVTGTGEELPGVMVQVKEHPTIGTQTDLNGSYTIEVGKNETLKFYYMGFETQEIKVNNRTHINVELKESSVVLDDIVITVPYGVAKKSTFTGSAGVVTNKIIAQSQVSNVTKALQGTVAGVQSVSPSGQPGSEATIRIRGVGSINASSNPLYVVDGVPYEGNLSSISAGDIESITVMKDAASATLYGSRAANGVVMITTKQGDKESLPTIDFSAKYGFSRRALKDYKQLNTNDYMELFWEAVRNERYDSQIALGKSPNEASLDAAQYASTNLVGMIGINPYGSSNVQPIGLDGKLRDGLNPLWNDNWDDALSQNAHYTDINLRVSGGSKNSRYYVSGGFLNDQGYVIESGFKRYTMRANLTTDIKKWLQFGINVSGAHSIQNYPKQDDSAINNVIQFARSMPSFYPIYKRNLETGAYLNGKKEYDFGEYRATSYARYNLAATMPLDKNEIKRDQASLRTFLQAEIVKNLFFKTSLNVDYNNLSALYYVNPEIGPSKETGGSSSKENVRTTTFTINNVLNYSFKLNDIHNFKILAGHEYFEFNTSNLSGSRTHMAISGYDQPSIGATISSFDGSADSYKLLSFFGNAEYSLLDRYYFSTSVRSDASSKFHPDHRWGTFWSVGASWRIVSEPFMSKFAESWLSNLSLRSSYGAQGNDNINDYYAYQARYAINNNNGYPGLVFDRLAAPELSWETNYNFNIGLDFGVLNNRISGTVEFFNRSSKNLLFNVETAPSIGSSYQRDNVGAMRNYGWELMLQGYPIDTKDWKWMLSLNATFLKNKITSLPQDIMWNGNKKWIEGGSLYDFYLVEWAGINPENGNPQWYMYKDGEKVVTETYTAISNYDDEFDKKNQTNKIKAGNSLPKVTGGIQSNLVYKDFTLDVLFSYSIGGKIYNGDKLSLQHQGSAGDAWSSDMKGRWTPENRDTDIPRLTTNPKHAWTNASTRFLVDRSFLRMKSATLSYNLPEKLLRRIGLKQTSVFLQAENLFTITKQQGLDPEQTFDGSTYYRYPSMKTISVGFNIKL